MKEEVKIGKDYIMADRFWTPVEIDEGNQIAIMQSLGVTKGPWPGYSMPQFGNNKYYGSDINHLDISDYNQKTRLLMDELKPIEGGSLKKGLWLPGTNMMRLNGNWKNALARAAGTFFMEDYDGHAWIGTTLNKNCAACIGTNRDEDMRFQDSSYCIAPAFQLDLSKIEVCGERIVAKK